MSLPITLLFATTTKGHFSRTDIYQKTLKDWQEQNFLPLFLNKVAHIKDGGESSYIIMKTDLESAGFDKVLVTPGKYKHFDASHSIGQLQDIGKLVNEVETDYIFFLEDDWLVRPKVDTLDRFLETAMDQLDSNTNISQIRIPRHLNDFEHYKTLQRVGNSHFYNQNDIFSFNPYIARTKDIQLISNSVAHNSEIIVDYINKGVLNSELTFTQFARQIRGDYSFWSFDSKDIQAFHIGSPEGEEDKLPE